MLRLADDYNNLGDEPQSARLRFKKEDSLRTLGSIAERDYLVRLLRTAAESRVR